MDAPLSDLPRQEWVIKRRVFLGHLLSHQLFILTILLIRSCSQPSINILAHITMSPSTKISCPPHSAREFPDLNMNSSHREAFQSQLEIMNQGEAKFFVYNLFRLLMIYCRGRKRVQ